MKHAFLLILFLFTVVLSNAKSKNYIEYHTIISTAEEALVNEDFNLSLKLYNNAFREFQFKFSQDVFHALQVAIILKDSVQSHQLLDSCFISGIEMKCLEDAIIIKKFLNSISKNEIENEYEKFRKIYFTKIDTSLQNQWNKRFHSEQFSKYNKDSSKSFLVCLKDNYSALKQYIEINN
jgi:hypothetical protein